MMNDASSINVAGVGGENHNETESAENLAVTRRKFLGIAAGALISVPLHPGAAQPAGEVPYRTLGRTGEKVSVIGLGGFHLGKPELAETDSIRIVRAAIDNGINFLDNSWDYNGGQSEIRMGKALRDGYRQRAFLMTKIDGRDKNTAARQIEESLHRLETDHIDLLQFHEIIRLSDPVRIFAEGGAIEAAIEAKKAGKVRYIGFTGHKNPDIHLKMLDTAASRQFRFDTVQMPLNVMDAHYENFEKKVLPVLVKADIGVLGMKPMGDFFILESQTVTALECLHYAMNLPTSVVITGCDSMRILDQALNAARSFRPMKSNEIEALLAKTAQAAQGGKYELYKTSHNFDSTWRNPEWLG
ncbi:MAG: aldo/keto reductase [Syntrophobacteraceae bacterium]|jgi:predicted aldo/keto reductase-like oxidoreductase